MKLKKVWEFKITKYFTEIHISDFDSIVVRNQERNEERFETQCLKLNILITSYYFYFYLFIEFETSIQH